MVELIDTHGHLTSPAIWPRVDEVLAAAAQAGVTRLITVACSLVELQQAIDLHARHPHVCIAAGIHPHDAAKATDADLARFAEAWRGAPGLVAAGEMGLDAHYDFSPMADQVRVLRAQLNCLVGLDLPVVIHCREAHRATVDLLKEAGFADRPVVFHCFSGTAAEAAELRGLGWSASFSGIITFRKAPEVAEACRQTPIDQLLFETDCPYLSPEPMRSVRPNEPRLLPHTVRRAAEVHGVPFEQIAVASTANACRFYRLPA